MSATPRLRDWFHLKPQFTSFKLVPQEHARYLFGERDNKLRDELLMSLKECAYSERGYHSIIWGSSGRGKTHLANNLLVQAKTNDLPLELVYVDCPTIKSAKEPLKTFFSAVFKSLPPKTVKRFVTKFVEEKDSHPEWDKRVLTELNQDRVIYRAITEGLVLPHEGTVRGILGWLGGEEYGNISNIVDTAPKQLEDGGQIARNFGALGDMLLLSEGKNLIFLVDEAERLQTIQSGEQYWTWLSALRESFRRTSVGLILFIIASNPDYIPRILMEHEIYNRIGASNIFSSPPFDPPDAESFLTQLLATMVQRDPAPESLTQLLEEAGEPLEFYPFTEDAFKEFIQHHSIGTEENKPQELLNHLERAAQRAITLGKKLIDVQVLQQVVEGF
jgi:Cdc6-like AAA superfamily ATPase